MAILDDRLRAEVVSVVSIEVREPTGAKSGDALGEIEYIDSKGAKQRRSLASVLALLPAWWALDASMDTALSEPVGLRQAGGLAVNTQLSPGLILSDGARLDLIDGQSWPGHFATRDAANGAPKDDTRVAWSHPHLGTLSASIDDVSRYTLFYNEPGAQQSSLTKSGSRKSASPARATSDRVVLTNGDSISGVVEALGVSSLISRAGAGSGTESAGGLMQVEGSQLASVVLSNTPKPATRPMVWLSDATVLAVRSLRFSSENASATIVPQGLGDSEQAGSPGVKIGSDTLRALAPVPNRLTALSTLEIVSGEAVAPRLYTEPARVREGESLAASALSSLDILLPGPMVVEWALPAGAQRVAMVAALEDPQSPWGDCTISLSQVSSKAAAGAPNTPLASVRLNSERPSARLEGALAGVRAGDRLRVRVEPGANGPVHDRVVLRRGLLLIEPGAPTPARSR